MNKQERKQHGTKRMKRRCKAMGIDPNSQNAKRAFLNQWKPCSCPMCSRKKVVGGKARWEIMAPPLEEPVILHNFGINENGDLVRVIY